MFENRKLVIASMHQKEKVMAPLLQKYLNVKPFVCPDLDTDAFGTFSGEIERLDDPLLVAQLKCDKAMQLTGYDLAVASEGSFFPHPMLMLFPVNEETMVFTDRKNGLVITEKHWSTDTNFSGREIKTVEELLEFASMSKFPSHALILRKHRTENRVILKGITNENVLLHGFHTLIDEFGQAFVETDMRAMFNPTRMQVIAQCAEKLMLKILSNCPACTTPGFAVTKSFDGLPCECCGTKTKSILYHVKSCLKCSYETKDLHPNGKEKEDPMYCDFCNP